MDRIVMAALTAKQKKGSASCKFTEYYSITACQKARILALAESSTTSSLLGDYRQRNLAELGLRWPGSPWKGQQGGQQGGTLEPRRLGDN